MNQAFAVVDAIAFLIVIGIAVFYAITRPPDDSR
jgi:hypothetical protein